VALGIGGEEDAERGGGTVGLPEVVGGQKRVAAEDFVRAFAR
jgi:hypothetical protein